MHFIQSHIRRLQTSLTKLHSEVFQVTDNPASSPKWLVSTSVTFQSIFARGKLMIFSTRYNIESDTSFCLHTTLPIHRVPGSMIIVVCKYCVCLIYVLFVHMWTVQYGRIRDIDLKMPARPPAFAFVAFMDARGTLSHRQNDTTRCHL